MIKSKKYHHPILYLLFMVIGYEQVTHCVYSQDEKQLIIVSDDEFPHWRYWNGDDDCEFIWVSTFNTDQNGNLFTVKEQNSFMFDGFDFVPLPITRKTHGLQSGINNQFWHETKDGIEVFSKKSSKKYQLSHRIDGYAEDQKQFNLTTISLKSNQFYIVTKKKLYLFDAKQDTIETILDINDTAIESFISIHTDQQQSVWIAGKNGVIGFDISYTKTLKNKTFEQHLYPVENPNSIEFVTVYPNHELSINVHDNGTHLFYLKNGDWKLLHKDRAILGWLGHDGGFWIQKKLRDGSRRMQYHTSHLIYEMKPNKYINSLMRTIVPSKESFWVSSHNGLVSFQAPVWRRDISIPTINQKIESAHFNSPQKSYLINHNQLLAKNSSDWKYIDIPHLGLGRNKPKFIMDHVNNSKLLFYGREIIEYNSNNNNPFSTTAIHDNYIHSYFINQDKQVYLALNKDEYKIVKYKNGNFEDIFQFHSHSGNVDYNDFIVRNNGEIWFIFENKVYRVVDREVLIPSDDEIAQLGELQHILYRNDDRVILSGEKGIFEWDGSQYIKLLDKDLGYIFDFLETEQNHQWFATHNGLYRYVNEMWLENNWQEGLPNGRSYFVKTDNANNMYAGGDMGFRIQHIKADVDSPETYILVTENNSEFKQGNEIRIRLRGRDRWDYTKPDRLLFSYKLNDNEWSNFDDNNTINLGGLSSGSYTIQARTMDRNLNIDPKPAAFSFTVTPPWYLEPVVMILSIASSFLIFFFAFYAYRNHMKLLASLHQTQHTVTLLERTKDHLSEAKTKAENATKAKDGFLARMSHEIRTPLNGIIGNLELLPLSNLKPKEKAFLQTAKVSANTLMEIIGDVLDFAKIEANKLELDCKVVSLATLFDETISVMSTRAEEKEILLGGNLSPDIPQAVHVDPIRFRQVMMNLIGNAIKFTDHGSVAVIMTCSSITNDQAIIHFEVKDTGLGFDSSRKDELFREFEQDDTSNKTAEGTGLGLSICKRIIEIMGGIIDCESQKGLGSRFWFEVPVLVLNEELLESTSNIQSEFVDSLHYEVTHPVLIIDDKEANLLLAKNQLTKLGIESNSATSGAEALDKVSQNQYSMLLVDCSMPEMDGFEFTKRFRSLINEINQGIPVIAVTAHVVSDIKDRCQAAGMDDYLSKPVKIDNLIEMIEKWIIPNQKSFKKSISLQNTHNLETYEFSLEEISKFTAIHDSDDLVQFLQVVSQEISDEYENLIQSVKRRDKQALLVNAHSIKGLSGPIRLIKVVDMMKMFLSQTSEVSWDEIESMLPEIKQWILQFQNSIQSLNMIVTKESS